MTEPIRDEDLARIRSMTRGGISGEVHASLPINVLGGLLARLDAAEAKLERIKQIVNPGQYLSLGMLVEIKEIVYG